jgi:hypothetical protein
MLMLMLMLRQLLLIGAGRPAMSVVHRALA